MKKSRFSYRLLFVAVAVLATVNVALAQDPEQPAPGKIRHMPPDKLGSGFHKPEKGQTSDISTCEIVVSNIVPPEGLPPFPEEINLGVTLNKTRPAIKERGYYGTPKSLAGASEPVQPDKSLNPRDENNKAVALGIKKEFKEALVFHQNAIMLDPHTTAFRTNYSSAELQYGDALLKEDKIDDASQHLKRAIFLDSFNAPARTKFTQCLERKGLNPKDPKLYLNTATEALKSGDLETAVVYSIILLAVDDSVKARELYGECLLKSDMVVEAFEQFVLAVEKRSSSKVASSADESVDLANCHRLLGDILFKQGHNALNSKREDSAYKRLQSAWIEYKRALFLNPKDKSVVPHMLSLAKLSTEKNPVFVNWLASGSAAAVAGDKEQAKTCYKKCEELASTSDEKLLVKRAIKSI